MPPFGPRLYLQQSVSRRYKYGSYSLLHHLLTVYSVSDVYVGVKRCVSNGRVEVEDIRGSVLGRKVRVETLYERRFPGPCHAYRQDDGRFLLRIS